MPGKGSYWTLNKSCGRLFSDNNYQKRIRRPKVKKVGCRRNTSDCPDRNISTSLQFCPGAPMKRRLGHPYSHGPYQAQMYPEQSSIATRDCRSTNNETSSTASVVETGRSCWDFTQHRYDTTVDAAAWNLYQCISSHQPQSFQNEICTELYNGGINCKDTTPNPTQIMHHQLGFNGRSSEEVGSYYYGNSSYFPSEQEWFSQLEHIQLNFPALY